METNTPGQSGIRISRNNGAFHITQIFESLASSSDIFGHILDTHWEGIARL